MIINKLVFPIKSDLSFVEGGIPQGMLTANSINRDILYVISPAVKETVITAFFQNQKQTENTQQATFILSDLSIDYLVSKDTSYYELVKDWNVWQTIIPSKALEFISYNRAGKIGISFAFKQLLEPSGYEGSQEITNDNFVINDSGSYIIKIPYYHFLGNDFTYNDVLIYNGGSEVSKKPAIALQGTTGTLEYSVDPSVYIGGYESVEVGLTESILSKLGENSGEIKLLRLKFNNYYTIEEVDGLILNTQEEIDNISEDLHLELANKVDKIKTETGDSAINQVYGTDYLGNDKVFKASELNVPNSVVLRDYQGVIEDLDLELANKVDKIKTETGDSAINQVYGTDYLGNDKVFKASELNVPNSVVLRDYQGVIEDLDFHNNSQNAHQDIRNMISALQGGIIPRGLLEYTTDNIRNDKTLLDTYIQNNYSGETQLGDMVRDLDNIEWYYNGEFWDELGPYSLIPLASMYNDGLMSNTDYQILSQLETDTAFYYNTHGIPVKIKFQKFQLAAGQTMDDALSTLPVIDYEAEGGYIPIIRYTFYDSDGNIVGESMGNKPITTGSDGDLNVKTPYFYKALQQYMDAGEDYATFLVAWKHSLTVDVVAESVDIFYNYINHSNYDYTAYGIIIPEGVLSVNSSLSIPFGMIYNKPIVFPDSVMTIHDYTFGPLLSNTKEIVLPSSLHTILEGNFSDLKSDYPVIIPSLVNEIGNDSFYNATIPYMVMLPQDPPSIAMSTFGESTFDIYVSDIYYDNYYYATNWVALRDRLKKLSELGLGG